MNDADPSRHPESLGDKIERIIEELPQPDVSLVEITDAIGDEGLLVLAVLLSLIFLVPVSIPGVSTVFGTAILVIGITRITSRKLTIPGRLGGRRLCATRLRDGFGKALRWFRRLEKVSKANRFQRLAGSTGIALFNNLTFIFSALLLMMPLGLVPFSNTLPAIALIFLALGMMQKDGVCILFGYSSALATVAYFGFLLLGGGWAIGRFVQ